MGRHPQIGQAYATPRPTVKADEDDTRKDGPCLKVLLIGDVFKEREHGYDGWADRWAKSAKNLGARSPVLSVSTAVYRE